MASSILYKANKYTGAHGWPELVLLKRGRKGLVSMCHVLRLCCVLCSMGGVGRLIESLLSQALGPECCMTLSKYPPSRCLNLLTCQ